MGVSKNKGTPKWMVKIMENPSEMDDLGVPLFLETPINFQLLNFSDFQVRISWKMNFGLFCVLWV